MEIECPYCEESLEINHDDGFGYEEGVKHQMQCSCCNKHFVFETIIIFHFDAEKADCLNGAEHDYEITNTNPVEFSMMECKICGDRRELTEQERIDFKICSKSSYFEKIQKKIF